MNDSEKNIIYTARDIEQYLAGKLSPQQMHAMEKAALDDPFLAEAMEGYEAMQHEEWNNQLVALREEINNKATVAKVIPLHKSKNNWWKAAAAILFIGTAATFTFILNNKKEGGDKTQIAKTTTIDTSLLAVNTPPTSVTQSLNPSASETIEDKNELPGSAIAQVTQPTKTESKNYIPNPTGPQLSPVAPVAAPITSENSNATAQVPVPPPAPSAANGNADLAGELKAEKAKSSAYESNDELLNKQRSQAPSKKEAVLNNFFTAQVVSADNTPLPFTNISIKKDNFGTYADAKGIVRLVSTDSVLQVEIKSVGYQAKTFALRSNQAQTKIILEEEESMARKDKKAIASAETSNKPRLRRATLLKDSAVNVEPADGWENYNTYVANNLEIPLSNLKSNARTEVEITFDVKPNGTVSNIRVNKSPGAEYDEAAKRLIQEGPQWKGKKGKNSSVSVKLTF